MLKVGCPSHACLRLGIRKWGPRMHTRPNRPPLCLSWLSSLWAGPQGSAATWPDPGCRVGAPPHGPGPAALRGPHSSFFGSRSSFFVATCACCAMSAFCSLPSPPCLPVPLALALALPAFSVCGSLVSAGQEQSG